MGMAIPGWCLCPPPHIPLPLLMNQGQVLQAGGWFMTSLAAAVGGFGAAPVAGGLGGFERGVAFDQATQPTPPHLSIELSVPKFPDLLTTADIVKKYQPPHHNHTEESKKAVAEYEWINTQHLWHLVRTNPGLTRFDTYKRRSEGLYPVSADYAYSTLHMLKGLKVLDGRSRFEGINFWTLLECLPEGIESLSVDCDMFPLPDPLPKPRSSLLVLDTIGSPTTGALLTLLEVFPNLTHLRVAEVRSNPSEPRESSLIPLPSSPRSGGRSLRNFDCFMGCDWGTVLRHIPSIVEWRNKRLLHVEDTTVLDERFGPRLELFRAILHPSSNGYSNSRLHDDPTNQFLVTHPHLREFDSIENLIKVDEMLRQPWACMGLERLTCRIVEVDRLNKEEESAVAQVMAPGYLSELTEDETRAIEKFHRCRAQHHGVYDRLASLTRLKHLDLGYENRNTGDHQSRACYTGEDGVQYLEYSEPTFDTLEMSLESGLDRLGALRDLEMIGFECINHRIGRAELDWMAKSWPKLRLMYGLEKERLYKIKYDKNRAALRKYFKRLRPDVVHDSLFKVKI